MTTPLSRTIFGLALFIGASTVSYMNLQDTAHDHYGTGFDIHTTLFVVLLTMFWPRMLYLINNAGSPSSSPSTSKSLRSTRLTTFRLSALAFVLGFGI
ncbi:MAG: hypothetical protein M1823_008698, partial [Watsoniomyces obsoletus]